MSKKDNFIKEDFPTLLSRIKSLDRYNRTSMSLNGYLQRLILPCRQLHQSWFFFPIFLFLVFGNKVYLFLLHCAVFLNTSLFSGIKLTEDRTVRWRSCSLVWRWSASLFYKSAWRPRLHAAMNLVELLLIGGKYQFN